MDSVQEKEGSTLQPTENGTAQARQLQQELIFNTSIDISFLVGVEPGDRFRFISVNNAFLSSAGLTRDQVEGKYAEEVIPPDLYPVIHKKYLKAIHDRQTVQWEDTSDYAIGRITGIISITPVFNEHNICTLLVGTLHDITERKRKEELLKAREKQLDLIYNTIEDIVFLISIEPGQRFRFSTVNQAFLRATGLQKDQVEGKYADEIIPEPSREFVFGKYRESIRDKKVTQWEETSEYPAGVKTGIVSITPIFNEQDECTMLVGAVHDITERIESERIVRENEFQFRMVIENELLGVAWASAEGKVLNANQTLCRMLGVPLDELMGNYFGEFTHPDDTRREEQLIRLMIEGQIDNYRIEKRYRTKQGTYIWVELNLTCYRTAAQKTIEYFIGIIQDINDRKRAEAEREHVAYQLNERIKELTTLYRAGQILQSESKSEEMVLQEIVSILPSGWQYPAITEARINFNDKEYRTPHFRTTPFSLSVTFQAPDNKEGKIEVVYTEERPAQAEGPFLAEERRLINMLAEMLRIYFERKAGTEQLILEKNLSRSIINSLPGIFYLQEMSGQIIQWNNQLEIVTGYSGEEISKMFTLDFFDENDQLLLKQQSMELYETGKSEAEAFMITKDGRRIPHFFNGQVIEYEGRPCVIGTGIDITERKKAEDQLLKEKELSESIINSLPGIFYLFDHNGKYRRWNKNHETVPGYTHEEMEKMYPLNFFDDNEKDLIADRIGKVFTTGFAEAEADFMGKDGTKTPYFFNGVMIDYEGEPCLMGMGIDITQRKKFEMELLEAEQKFRDLVEKSLVGVYIMQNNLFAYVNPRFAEIFGYTQEELIDSMNPFQIFHESEQGKVAGYIKARTKGEIDYVHYEVIGRKKNGTNIYAEVFGSRTTYKGKTAIIGSLMDITERKIAEEALLKSEANLHTIFEATDTIYTLQDTNFQVQSFNKRASRFMKKEMGQELELHTNILSYFPEERRPRIYEHMKKVMEGETITYESSYLQKDSSYNWYHVRMIPIRGSEKKIFGLMMAVSDITDKKLLEQQILNQRVQEQKTMTRAVLTAQEKERNKIGQELHDNINQILVGAKMCLGLAEQKTTGKEKLARQSMELIDKAINEIRFLTREQVTPQKTIDLEELVQSLSKDLNDHTTIETSLVYEVTDPKLINDDLKVNVYRILQEQVNNIVRHAHAQHVNLMVKADTENLHVVVTDDGLGFNTENKRKGIGLSNIMNRVDSYNGSTTIESSPGGGCRVELHIPL